MQLTASHIENLPSYTDVLLELFLELDSEKPDYPAFFNKINILRNIGVSGYRPVTYTYTPEYLELAKKEYSEILARGELPVTLGSETIESPLSIEKTLAFALEGATNIEFHNPLLVEDTDRYIWNQDKISVSQKPKSFYKTLFLAALFQKHYTQIVKNKSRYNNCYYYLDRTLKAILFRDISNFFTKNGTGYLEEFNFDSAFNFMLKTDIIFDFLSLDRYQQSCYGELWTNLYLPIVSDKTNLEKLVRGIFKYSSAQSIPYCLRSGSAKYYLTDKLSGSEFLKWFNEEGLDVNVRTLSAFETCIYFFDESVTDLYDTFIMYKFKDNKKSIGHKLMKRIEQHMEYIK